MPESLSEINYLRLSSEISEDDLDITFDYHGDEDIMSEFPPGYFTVFPSRFRRFMYRALQSVPEVKNDNPLSNEPTAEDSPWLLEPPMNEHIEGMLYEEKVYAEWYRECYLDGLLRMTVTFITMRDRKMYTGIVEIPSHLFTKFRYDEYRIHDASLPFTLTLKEDRAGNEFLQYR